MAIHLENDCVMAETHLIARASYRARTRNDLAFCRRGKIFKDKAAMPLLYHEVPRGQAKGAERLARIL